MNVARYHGGSTLWLALLVPCYSPTFHSSILTMHGSVSLAWNAATLPLLVLPALLYTGTICRKLLTAQGVADPLQSLYSWLALLHSAPLAPPPLLLRWYNHTPQGQCHTLLTWLTLEFGVLIPLLYIAWLERLGRRDRKSVV